MASLNEYLKGYLRVPLSLLTSEGFAECPAAFSSRASVTEFQQFLNNRSQPITGIVSPQKLDHVLDELAISRARFRQTLDDASPYVNKRHRIDCLLGQHCLEQAKRMLGVDFECTLLNTLSRTHTLTKAAKELPGKYSDGEICRQVLLHDDQPDLAQQWLDRLCPGKQKHLMMVFNRPKIWSAMKDVALFPGLWEDIKLGNWAKHLAAHVDELIVTYWRHMRKAWDQVFGKLDQGLHLRLDPYTGRFLQFKAPAWSKTDRESIRAEMETGALFHSISDQAQREKLFDNICGIRAVLPGVLTFHENMRYLTLGAKILEHHIEVKSKKRRRGTTLVSRKPESLMENLEKDRTHSANYVEVQEGQYRVTHEPLDAKRAFLQLFLISLRLFPFLGSDPPLQDIKGRGMDAFVDYSYKRRLCMGAFCLGYRNRKVMEGIQLSSAEIPRVIPKKRSFSASMARWRGGMPTINTFLHLRECSFLPTLHGAKPEGPEPSPLLIKQAFIWAFFTSFTTNVDQSKPIVDYTVIHQQSLALETSNNEMDGVMSNGGQQARRGPKNVPPVPKAKEPRRVLGQGSRLKPPPPPPSSSTAGEKTPADIKRMALNLNNGAKKNNKRPRATLQARALAHQERTEAEVEISQSDSYMLEVPDIPTLSAPAAPAVRDPVRLMLSPNNPAPNAGGLDNAATAGTANYIRLDQGHVQATVPDVVGPKITAIDPGDTEMTEVHEVGPNAAQIQYSQGHAQPYSQVQNRDTSQAAVFQPHSAQVREQRRFENWQAGNGYNNGFVDRHNYMSIFSDDEGDPSVPHRRPSPAAPPDPEEEEIL
ncbi:DUF3723 domain [Fusarium albosuccineum]|uniref:DUF3723 domain n=1 Tax=Fusarium albosuccineum TaxID=1237068 RepID=A0A8H4LEL5_9HYPO|nr:DUF3723 domain [Fusarium albosuccineum]